MTVKRRAADRMAQTQLGTSCAVTDRDDLLKAASLLLAFVPLGSRSILGSITFLFFLETTQHTSIQRLAPSNILHRKLTPTFSP